MPWISRIHLLGLAPRKMFWLSTQKPGVRFTPSEIREPGFCLAMLPVLFWLDDRRGLQASFRVTPMAVVLKTLWFLLAAIECPRRQKQLRFVNTKMVVGEALKM